MSTALVVRLVLWLWLIAAFFVGRSSFLRDLPPGGVQGIILCLTAVLILAYRRIAPFRAWLDCVDLRTIVLLHFTRFIGFYFLFLYRHGELPAAWAIPAGIGDIAVAVFALMVVAFPFSEATRPRALYLWNVVGLADILLVLFSAMRVTLAEPRALVALTHPPLSFLPTFLVPLIIASHVLVFARLARRSAGI